MPYHKYEMIGRNPHTEIMPAYTTQQPSNILKNIIAGLAAVPLIYQLEAFYIGPDYIIILSLVLLELLLKLIIKVLIAVYTSKLVHLHGMQEISIFLLPDNTCHPVLNNFQLIRLGKIITCTSIKAMEVFVLLFINGLSNNWNFS